MTAKKSCYEIISFFSFSSSSPKATTIIGGIYEAHGGQPWACHGALQGQLQPLLCAAGVVGPELGAVAGVLCRWFVVGCSFAGLGRFPEEEAALGNHSAQSPASV